MHDLPDCQLMVRVAEGDYRAFDVLYDRHRDAVRRFLYSLTSDHEIADDGVQEVFLRLFRARRRYRPTGSFTTYLFQIARNYYLTEWRKCHRRDAVRPVQQGPGGADPFAGLVANRRVEPEYHLIEGYRRWRIHRAIASLPTALRLVFVLAHLEGMPYAAIAAVLGVPVGTVKSRMFAAVRALKRLLEEEQP